MVNLVKSENFRPTIDENNPSNVFGGTSIKNRIISSALTTLVAVSSVTNVVCAENTKINSNSSKISQKGDSSTGKSKSASLGFYNNHKIPIISSGILVAAATIVKLATTRPRYEQLIIDCLTSRVSSRYTTLDDWFTKLGGTQDDINWYLENKCINSTDKKGAIIEVDVPRTFSSYDKDIKMIAKNILHTHNENNSNKYTQGMDRVLRVAIDKLFVSENKPIPSDKCDSVINITPEEESKLYHVYKTLVPSIFVGREEAFNDKGFDIQYCEKTFVNFGKRIDNSKFVKEVRGTQYDGLAYAMFFIGGLNHVDNDKAVKLFDNIICDKQMYHRDGSFDSDKAYKKLSEFSYALACENYYNGNLKLVCQDSRLLVNSLLQTSRRTKNRDMIMVQEEKNEVENHI